MNRKFSYLPKIILTLGCCFLILAVQGQQMTQEQAADMAKRIRTMTPQQIVKFRDSLMNAVMHKQAQALPNGNQLLLTHHYDTTYTTVSFHYTKRITQNSGSASGQDLYVLDGKSAKAPMLYEANGNTIVRCNFNMPGADTSTVNKMAGSLTDKQKYMTPQQAASARNISSQMSFSSASTNDNSLNGTASHTGHYGSTDISTLPPVTDMAFSFTYDPVQVLSTIVAGADITRHTVSNNGGTAIAKDEPEGLGIKASTDPKYAKIVGATQVQSDPNETYMTVAKTVHGFKILYTKIKHLNDTNTDITETLTASIGE